MYMCAVDGDRMGVSLIQSNAADFGAHVFEPNTRISLQNRGLGFSLEPGHPAEYGPGRRPPHTLSPALVTRPDGTLAIVLGSMGGDTQPRSCCSSSPGSCATTSRPAERWPPGGSPSPPGRPGSTPGASAVA
jgi:gamma-glutamyltranspeptidase